MLPEQVAHEGLVAGRGVVDDPVLLQQSVQRAHNNLGLPPGHNNSKSEAMAVQRVLGLFLGAAAQSDADVSAEVAPPPADLRTAEHLGARVAEVAQQLVAGRQALAALKEAA